MPITSSRNYQNHVSDLEIKLRYGCGIFLAIISMILTLSLFLNLAGPNVIRQIVMASLALGLEASKVLTFRINRYRAISIFLIAISIIASFGSALVVVEENKIASVNESQIEAHQSNKYQTSLAEIYSIDQQISVLISRLSELPPDFISAGKTITNDIQSLRAQRSEDTKFLSVAEAFAPTIISKSTTMFFLLSIVTTVPEDIIVLILLMFMALLLELCILTLTGGSAYTSTLGNQTTPKSGRLADTSRGHKAPDGHQDVSSHGFADSTSPRAAYKAPINAEGFLQAMIDPDTYPILRGRDNTGQRLGLNYAKSKEFVDELLAGGKIRVEGKRLVLCHPQAFHVAQTSLEDRVS